MRQGEAAVAEFLQFAFSGLTVGAIYALVALIQMRFPALYFEMLRDQDIAQSLSDILQLNKLQQEADVGRKSDVIKGLYADQDLRQFLNRTRNIPCDAAAIKPWIQLTQGNPLA